MSVIPNSSRNKTKDIHLPLLDHETSSVILMFPSGCGGCPGLCCVTICGEPPDVMPRSGPSKQCRELTSDGLCGIHLRNGYDNKPSICKKLQVGSAECLDARREAGL